MVYIMTSKDIAIEIQEIFEQNKLDDLKYFLKRRQSLNNTNMYLIYLFHLIQSAGILTTTVAAGYDQRYLIWIGVALNMLASLINVYEKTNNNILKKLLADINKIKEGTYVDEGILIDTDKPASNTSRNTSVSNQVVDEQKPEDSITSPLITTKSSTT